jgi:uncharacterized protein YqjF (DUF2071 family)
MFIADWLDVIFVHFRISPERLALLVPLPLDLHQGDAYVSLVAFTQSNLRPSFGGRIAALLASPLARHEFLNVRTYVRCGDGAGAGAGASASGIFFMTEWIPNRLAALVGPRTYGLPYRLGRLSYRGMRREIEAAGRGLTIAVRGMSASPMQLAAPAAGRRERMGEAPMPRETFDEFLLERYTAFTSRNGIVRRFDVEHVPWPQRRVEVDLIDTSLLALSGPWLEDAELVAAHYSPGVRDVIIGRPRRVLPASLRRHARA